MNNTIKIIKRDSFGTRNFERLKQKVFWQQAVIKAL
ncbi:hypothetical protein ERJ70_08220 [Sediminibacillus dalangtanensis]|uniref:Transposase n=1 Tax=Sediminibacillus dalangtanensis TaxID=2729421 RepID=A0ABX7VZ38_9BACI|nr:hypothetical protein ERJ70_08220 [Sediminibacillus dalangtanensis]